MASAAPNIPEFSVSELAHSVRRTLEDRFGLVRVRGELSGFKVYGSGHAYFDLKDADAVLAGVMWKGNYQRLGFRGEDGLEVIATGKLSTYGKSSRYQLIVERMEVAGVGALLKQIEERRRRLEAEGLFDRAAKPPRPFLPAHIGVVTSPQGAVIRDILHRLHDRFPRRVTLWPVPVQGDGAAARIAAAIRGFNAMPQGQRPDLLIVARGGGSIEDLMAFNEEAVVRAAAASAIPLISAVGHETDTTLIDYASALRAPTPTAAAELAVPVRADLLETLADLGLRAQRAERRARLLRAERLGALAARLPRPAAIAGMARQRLDDAGERLPRALKGRVRLLRTRFEAVGGRLSVRLLTQEAARERARLESPRVTPNPALLRARLAAARAALASGFRLAESLSPQAVLARGFTMVRLPDGSLARNAAVAAGAAELRILFADGDVAARPLSGPDAGPAVKPRPATPRASGGTPGDSQGDLF
ncbi:exodeoxyribonuclease VII large subunit [Sandaracinobacter neustonicus]|uniref:Exodeoxyribonuclease 7 large subunit n=1 Tax=Sandaracinobacter neustonicus TaxID=1715348 RepID=A0A501XDT1_9SPHN|nr:exodeoxyribonuclease VII large subunit [Sandaracinobacter neustonicus]TPE58670.1 exodeoxyribonuclease VII large subunit [Sandaracinobacter neustonicus]